MALYTCQVCKFLFDDKSRGVKFEDLRDNWTCPDCGAGKSNFLRQDDKAPEQPEQSQPTVLKTVPADVSSFIRNHDEVEEWMDDIHAIAESGHSIDEAMRTHLPVLSWDDILIMGKQLNGLPLANEDKVVTQTVIGPNAAQPLILDTPILISHMAFGSLSLEAQLALAKGSAMVGTAIGSGGTGIQQQSFSASRKYIFEYVPNQYSVTPENLLKVDAIEIKIGQSCTPGMGSFLPGAKVTAEIGAALGFPSGKDIASPSRYPDIHTPVELKAKIDWLRDASNGRPIGVKLAAGHIENDLEFALQADPDFITIDGRPGGIGGAPKFIKMATSLPTIYALSRARRFMDRNHIGKTSLIITGGLRISPDFAKALAMGADAVSISTSALIALGCQQYKICNTGRCPMGIATQDPVLRSRLDVEKAAQRVANFLRVSTEELMQFAKLTGYHNVHDLSLKDLCTCNSEISNHTGIQHA
ncbi:MAG: glutamate synthase-related protein [Lentisphaeria bacterium]